MPIQKNSTRNAGEKMSQAYTPSLKRKEYYLIKKSRILPIPGEVCVNRGDEVSIVTTVAKAKIPGEPYMVKVAAVLGVDPEDIGKYMLKKVGDEVKRKETIARYKALFGLIKTDCPSPVDGILENVSEVTGQVIIREHPIPVEMDAYIPGKILDIMPNEGVTIQCHAAFIQGTFGIGGEAHGELMMVSKAPDDIVTAELITSECEGKIIVGGSLVTSDALKRSVEMGASGIIVGGISDKDLTEFLGYRIGVAITGQEKAGLTLVATEGFGRMNMLEKTFKILRKLEGKVACINGATQVRAGVIRPEVIIPLEALGEDFLTSDNSGEYRSKGLTLGTLVRIIQEPYFGAIGKVHSLPSELQMVKTESKVRIVEVLLDDGRLVTVSRANVEIIEE